MHDRDMNFGDIEEAQGGILETMEKLPTQAYLGFAFGSMFLSAFFFLIGRHSVANFIGQWVPSIGMMALVYKLLRPSHERPMQQMKDTMETAKDTARSVGSKMSSSDMGGTRSTS